MIVPTPGAQTCTIGVSRVVPTWMWRQGKARLPASSNLIVLLNLELRSFANCPDTEPKAALPHVLPCEAACGGVLSRWGGVGTAVHWATTTRCIYETRPAGCQVTQRSQPPPTTTLISSCPPSLSFFITLSKITSWERGCLHHFSLLLEPLYSWLESLLQVLDDLSAQGPANRVLIFKNNVAA